MKKEKMILFLIAIACFFILAYLSAHTILNWQPVKIKNIAASSFVAPKPSLPPYTGDINPMTASLEELDTLPGIGPSTAQAFHDYLSIPGNCFIFPEDITNVKGIGSKKLEDLLPFIWLPPPPQPTIEPLF